MDDRWRPSQCGRSPAHGPGLPGDAGQDPLTLLCAIILQLRAVPRHAAHYGALAVRRSQRALAGIRPKAAVLALGIAIAWFAAKAAHPVVLGLATLALVAFAYWVASSVLERPVGLFLLSRRTFPLDGITPARETLRLLGLDDATIARICVDVDAGREVKLASFDQENRLLSEVGAIPYFANELITREQFIPRIRHRLDLVAAFGVVAIRKAYQARVSIENEALALAALAAVPGVPRIVRLEWRTRVMYQSFLPGENLGSLMAAKGATVSVQHRVATGRPPRGAWTEETIDAPLRRDALRVMADVAPPTLVHDLSRMLERVHEAGVVLGDVKFGNVLMQDGRPVLCDFDWSRVIGRRRAPTLDRRDEERDNFNYSFGASMPTLIGSWRELTSLVAARPALGDALMDFGGGVRFGRQWSSDGGTGRWLTLRGHLPDMRGRRIVDLGSRDVILLIELLRAGVERLTTLQPDATAARFARACHGLAELVDGRRYAFEVVVGSAAGAGAIGADHDTATLFDAPGGIGIEQVGARLGALAGDVRHLVLQPDLREGAITDRWMDAARRSGFTPLPPRPIACTSQPLLLAQRA